MSRLNRIRAQIVAHQQREKEIEKHIAESAELLRECEKRLQELSKEIDRDAAVLNAWRLADNQ